jgi:hypothetical protein
LRKKKGRERRRRLASLGRKRLPTAVAGTASSSSPGRRRGWAGEAALREGAWRRELRVRSGWRRRRPAVVRMAWTGRSGEEGVLTEGGGRGSNRRGESRGSS